MKQKVNRVLRRSVEYAFAHRAASLPFVREHAQEMSEEVMYRHIDLYVNEYSVDLGEEGRRAVEMLFERAGATGIIPAVKESLVSFVKSRVHLLHALREARRPWLQDVGRFDLVDAVVAHRADAVPSRPRPNRPSSSSSRTTTRTRPRGRGARTSAGSTMRSRREAGVGQLRENRRAAGDLDELLHPADPRDQRIVPLLEERPQPDGKRAGGLADAIEIRRQPIRQRLGFGLAADESAEHPDHLEDFGDAALVEGDDGNAAANELGAEIGLQIGKREDEIRFERFDLVELRVDERGHLRLLARLRRTYRVARHADDAIALAEEIEGLGRFLGQADDATRVLHTGTRSVKTNPSRSTVMPLAIGISRAEHRPLVGKGVELAAFAARIR